MACASAPWLHKLEYKPRGYVLIGLSLLILAGSTFVNLGLGLGDFWMPEWILRVFGF